MRNSVYALNRTRKTKINKNAKPFYKKSITNLLSSSSRVLRVCRVSAVCVCVFVRFETGERGPHLDIIMKWHRNSNRARFKSKHRTITYARYASTDLFKRATVDDASPPPCCPLACDWFFVSSLGEWVSFSCCYCHHFLMTYLHIDGLKQYAIAFNMQNSHPNWFIFERHMIQIECEEWNWKTRNRYEYT